MQVRQNSLFVGKTTYSNQDDAQPGSVMDFDVDPETGKVLAVKVSGSKHTGLTARLGAPSCREHNQSVGWLIDYG